MRNQCITVASIILCAGTGTRAGLGFNKLLYKTDGVSIVARTLSKFNFPETEIELPIDSGLPFNRVSLNLKKYIVCSEADYASFSEIIADFPNTEIIIGGASRTESVFNALRALKNKEIHIAVIHDGARPFVQKEDIIKSIGLALAYGSAVAYSPSTDTVKLKENGYIRTPQRNSILSIKTPQAFDYLRILCAYETKKDTATYTDDSSVYEECFGECSYFECGAGNIKITKKEDLDYLNTSVLTKGADMQNELLIGTGFDVHRLVEDRKLVLGGAEIPHTHGLLGHSDADVVTHALMDAMLSACGLNDIGHYFPDTDAQFKGIQSLKLLERVNNLINENGWILKNISLVIHAQAPKLAPYIPIMKENLSRTLSFNQSRIGITATTHEGLGFVGLKEGIAVSASVLLTKHSNNP